MTPVNHYNLTDNEVLDSGLSCVVIDDTGTPGQESGSKYLHATRKTWVAVLLTPAQFSVASSELPRALQTLEKLCGGREFHMTDIYRGHKTFKGVSPEQRLGAIEFLAHIFYMYRYPILVQTLDDIEARKFSDQIIDTKFGSLDLRNTGELALWMILHLIQDHLNDLTTIVNPPAYIVIDEGKWKSDRSISVHGMTSDPTAFAGEKIYSISSHGFPCLQLADFAAYCINRQQWLMASEKKNDFDIAFLQIISKAQLNTINIPDLTVDLDLWVPSDYDFLRGASDERKGMKSR